MRLMGCQAGQQSSTRLIGKHAPREIQLSPSRLPEQEDGDMRKLRYCIHLSMLHGFALYFYIYRAGMMTQAGRR